MSTQATTAPTTSPSSAAAAVATATATATATASSDASATTGKRKLPDGVGEDAARKGDEGDARDVISSGSIGAFPSTLVPIRVDARSEDKTVRIVDTILLDPTCWPVTLYKPLHESVEENVFEMAHTILSDAEVQGMGRTVRHFTGRLQLWNPKLQEAIEDQVRPQLYKVLDMQQNSKNDFRYHEIAPKKESNGNTADAEKTAAASSDDATRHDTPRKRPPPSSSLVPISIRLVINDVVVHDDFFWDKNTTHPTCPLAFARDMADELNLPDEAAVAIATTIVEQLHGLAIDATPDPTPDAENSKPDNPVSGGSDVNKNAATMVTSGGKPSSSEHGSNSNGRKRGAWRMDSKETASMSAQIVAHHRSI